MLCVALRTTSALFPASPRYCCGLHRRHHNHNHHNNAISTLLHTATTWSRYMIMQHYTGYVYVLYEPTYASLLYGGKQC